MPVVLVVSALFSLAIGVWPTLLEAGHAPKQFAIPGTRVTITAIWAWFILYALQDVGGRIIGGRRVEQYRNSQHERADMLAGNIDEIGGIFAKQLYPRAEVQHSERIAAGLLQGIADTAAAAAGAPEGVKIQAALVVLRSRYVKRGQKKEVLKTVNYNQLAASRSYSEMDPADQDSPVSVAYSTRRPKIVPDTSVEPYRNKFAGKKYKSVAAFPVLVRCLPDQALAVVSIDATEPHVLTEEMFAAGLERAIQPYLKLIGLLQLAEKMGGRNGNQSA